MGIHNIHILHEPVETSHSARKLQDYVEAKRIVEHRAGKHHPYGSKRHDCPLCQAGK